MEETNLYQTPSADVSNAPALSERLYSPGQMVFAAFFGSPVAGFLLLAANFRELGQQKFRRYALLVGVVSNVALLLMAITLPDDVPILFTNVFVPIVYSFGVLRIARHTQGAAFRAHLDAGGGKHSHWRVLLLSITVLFLYALVAIAVVFLLPESFWL